MNVKTVKKPEKRVESPYIGNLEIQSFGHNNLYPQEIVQIVSCSESASTCLDRYISFISGNGFKDIGFSQIVVNNLGNTSDDILQLLSSDIANYRGFALLVNYNVFGKITEIYHTPFENCRLCEPDEFGDVAKIAVHPDWTGQLKRNKKTISVKKENIDYIDIFNPDLNIISKQIEEAGGIENYKGQILWVSEAGSCTYPKPVHDAVVSQMSTEEGLGNISNRNTRNNFLPSKALVTKKGQNTQNEDDDSISKALSLLQGDNNTGKIVLIEIEHEEEMPTTLDLQGANYDKDFTVTTTTSSQKIYAAFNQEIWYRVLNGSIGFSSQMMQDAYTYYSLATNKERRMVERAFEKIFKHWYNSVDISFDYSIQPLQYTKTETDTQNLISLYEKNLITLNQALQGIGFSEKLEGNKYISDVETTPLAVRIGVGGTQTLQSILTDQTLSEYQKV